MKLDDAYTDWQVHYETCPRCRRDQTCEIGEEIKRRNEESGTSPGLLRDKSGTSSGCLRDREAL